ncbi:hypothetical protein [Arthrobacter sp. CJ23]|uniref:hypothetical protein n=1 Tax=Arthrobacter sp. CJ23 TaxID=2972479 RepID=UPI00215D4BEF|nr:hypothetical protein [Arthrobacter sp. CJ23]UVJ37906.1 hypothetical protein NVV90_11520 [Arthrobacter sp. CJ23]
MGIFSESIDVVCTPAGRPAEIRWQGLGYVVCAEPVRWYERRQWWVEESRAPLGSGAGLVDHEIWRVQLERSPEAPSPDPQAPWGGDAAAEPLLTLDLVRHVGSGRWRLLRIHDAAQSQATEPDEAA